MCQVGAADGAFNGFILVLGDQATDDGLVRFGPGHADRLSDDKCQEHDFAPHPHGINTQSLHFTSR